MSESAPSARPDLEAGLNKLRPLLHDHFRMRQDARAWAKVSSVDTSEWIHFEHLILEISDEPSYALIFQHNGRLGAHVTPRLELHLDRLSGLHNTRSQLGRIAQYAGARRLQEEYPILSVTTYARLATTVGRLIPEMRLMTATHFSDPNIPGGINEAREEFDRANGYTHQTSTALSLAMLTAKFIETYRDYE